MVVTPNDEDKRNIVNNAALCSEPIAHTAPNFISHFSVADGANELDLLPLILCEFAFSTTTKCLECLNAHATRDGDWSVTSEKSFVTGVKRKNLVNDFVVCMRDCSG